MRPCNKSPKDISIQYFTVIKLIWLLNRPKVVIVIYFPLHSYLNLRCSWYSWYHQSWGPYRDLVKSQIWPCIAISGRIRKCKIEHIKGSRDANNFQVMYQRLLCLQYQSCLLYYCNFVDIHHVKSFALNKTIWQPFS